MALLYFRQEFTNREQIFAVTRQAVIYPRAVRIDTPDKACASQITKLAEGLCLVSSK